jgi:transposase
MSIILPKNLLNITGQVIKDINVFPENGVVQISCGRDRRFSVYDPLTSNKGTVNRYIRRTITDLPFYCYRCMVEIELAEVRLPSGERHIESNAFVDKGCYYSRRFCQLVSNLCRYMSISTVAKHFKLRWETVKNMDKAYLQWTLPALNISELSNLKYMGVDEVARAKGHDYMTVVYNLENGQLIWVHEGRTSDVLVSFIKQLSDKTRHGIVAVAMDMGRAYQKAIREELPNADIVFDRFHVMQNYSKAIDNQRRAEFRKANEEGKAVIKGSRYLLLKNKTNLNEDQRSELHILLQKNANLSTVYMMKEQLQLLWQEPTYARMSNALKQWCQMADDSNIHYLKKFAKLLREHKRGICNYAKYPITTSILEANNVSIGMVTTRHFLSPHHVFQCFMLFFTCFYDLQISKKFSCAVTKINK